jgi:hypothetical protein
MNNKENRSLGTNEKVYWVLDQKITTQFAVVAEINGNTTENTWRQALDAVQQRHPNLSLQIAGNEYSTAHFQHVDDCKIPLRVIFSHRGDTWNSVVEEELNNPLDITIAPLARAVLIQQSGKTVFIFISNHSIGDGMSAALFIRDVLSAVSGKTIDSLMPLPPLETIAGVVENEMTESDVNVSKQAKNCLSPRAKINISRVKFSAELTAKLLKRAKKEHATVHGALGAAFIIAMREFDDSLLQKPVRILHPLSTRKTLGIGDAYGMLASMITIPYDPSPEETFWNLARTVRQGVAATQNTEWIKDSITATQGLFSCGLDIDTVQQALQQGTLHEIMLTNLGLLPFATDYGTLELTSLWGPMVLTLHEEACTVGVTTFNGELALTGTSLKSYQALLEITERIIEKVCGSEESLQIKGLMIYSEQL